MRETWEECVIVELQQPHGVQIVWDPAHAARLLTDCWPVQCGFRYGTALNRCTDAAFGTYPWKQARSAFIAAIDEERVRKLR
ncbi:DUF982 domain-containing protein [Ensifer sp. T173]|uniref:DUF982 domain-containing protein n=1 Tax=Ensifer canadensis TaxID=555315 RepID=A0AAW4FXH8_9HYPH|nr:MULTISPECIES: DUF982 domain-containing protein [Ensifer]KQY70300.1 hypothetical protein ASD52_30350 [Ensifer sp. Root142]MBM3096145.1 DUF982 domain-containing protein [Ensifer canadensis]UBI79939.1 DUF982 domain-containing protein [Ensifer canadensis]